MSDQPQMNTQETQQAADRFRSDFISVQQEIAKAVVGQRQTVEDLLTCLFAGGHALLEGVPGIGKTLLVRTIAQAVDLSFGRVQFTPDLMPADITGTTIVDEIEDEHGNRKRAFRFQPGPIFANIVLADEINRATPKTQSALLEAMQERRATIGGETYPLTDPGEPFLVLATQNPIEQEGTYPLPEAQVDRFMLKIKVGYPTPNDERVIIDRMMSTLDTPTVDTKMSLDQLSKARLTVDQIYLDDKLKDYIVSLVQATRDPAASNVSWKLDMPKLI